MAKAAKRADPRNARVAEEGVRRIPVAATAMEALPRSPADSAWIVPSAERNLRHCNSLVLAGVGINLRSHGQARIRTIPKS